MSTQVFLEGKIFLKQQQSQKKEGNEDKKDFFELQLKTLVMKGFEFPDYFIDIGIPEDYLKAQHDFKEFKY